MTKLVLLAGCVIILLSCSPKSIDPYAPTNHPVGEWTQEKGGAGGFDNYGSLKNFQYEFNVATDNQGVTIKLTSQNLNVQYALYDRNGLLRDVQGSGQNLSGEYTLYEGTYRLVVTADRQAVGRFSLTLTGTQNGATLIPAQVLESGTQNWGPLGGGGDALSFKNHFWSVDVSEDDTSIDAELQSDDTNARIWIYNTANGQFTSSRAGAHYTYEIKEARKNTYLLMASTSTRGSTGNYNLRITGKVANLTKVDSQSMSVTGQWSASSKVDQSKLAYDEYTLQLTDDGPNPLDIEILSNDTSVELYLQSVGGSTLSNPSQSSAQNKSFKIVQTSLPKGLYKITARTSAAAKGKYGTYTLNVFARFSDFKKI